MNDQRIVELYWQRDESALRETQLSYGAMLLGIARRILEDAGESEETVNDTYLRAWNTIPPSRPFRLGAFLSKITRELAIDRYRRRKAEKRTGNEYALSLEELSECIPGGEQPEEGFDADRLAGVIGDYLRTASTGAREAFVLRYFYALSLQEIARRQGSTLSAVKTALSRTRAGLREYLEKEGYTV